MGIGIALATGLVQGFHQNIQEEKARRQGEQEKLDSYKELVMNASLTSDNFSKTNADMINNMIASAQGKIDNRERINIFGQQGERVDVDFTDLVSKLSSNAQDDTTYAKIGTFQFEVPEEYSDQAGTIRADVIKMQGLYNSVYTNPEAVRQHLAANPDQIALFREQIPILASSVLSQRAISDKTGQVTRQMSLDQIEGYKFLNEFFSVDDYQQFRAEVGTLPKNPAMKKTFSIYDTGNNETDPTNLMYVPGRLFGNDELKYVPVTFEDLTGFDPNKTPQALAALAERQGEDLQYFVYNFAKEVDDIQDLNDAFTSVTTLYDMGAVNAVPSQEESIAIGKYLANSPELKDDPVLQAKVMMPFLPPLISRTERDMVRGGFKDPNYFSSKSFDVQFAQLYGEKLSGFDERIRAMTRGRNNLNRLMKIVEETTFTGGSIFENIYQGFQSLFGETGKIDQVMSLMGVSSDDDEYAGIKSYLTNGQGGEVTLISEANTLRYILAADLARAEDSAGRLSDGDIQRNLSKLTGFGPQTKLSELAALKAVSDTLADQERSVEVMKRVVANKSISAEDRMYIRADSRARLAREAYFNSVDEGEGTQAGNQPVGPMTFKQEDIFATDPNNRDVNFAQKNGIYYQINPDGSVIEVNEDEAMAAYNAGRQPAQNTTPQPSTTQGRPPLAASQAPAVNQTSPVVTAPGGKQGMAPPADDADAAMLAAGEAAQEKKGNRISSLDLAGKKKTPTPDGNFMIDGVKHKRIEENGQIFYEPVM